MTRIGVRELRQHASRYLLRVKAGETVEITERGRLVALLVAPGVAASARDRLVRSGRLSPATSSFELPAPRSHPVGALSTDEALAEGREERLR
ncbi:MAG: type II toxin-antitoxin system Phd/YefM family antitoxin [Acidimicrobiales bacterium]